MSELKKPPLILLLAILLAGSVGQVFPQSTSMEGISDSTSFGITYGTMHSAFKRDLKFDIGVQMVVDAAVDLLTGSVEEAKRLQMNPQLFISSVVAGVERSIKENSKAVDLGAHEEKILYERVMAALREQIQLLGNFALDTTQPPPDPKPPVPVDPPPTPKVTPEVTPEPPQKVEPQPPKPEIPRRTDGYYLNTFVHFGWASAGQFDGRNNLRINMDPGTTWGYGIAAGLHRSKDVRMEVEASWKGSSAKPTTAEGASGLDISYYSLMINAYKDFEMPFVDNLDFYAGLGLGWSVASLDGNVSEPGVFGNIPETGDLAFAYQFMLGANYRFTDRLSAILAYRIFKTGSFNGYNPDFVHLIELALRMDL